MQPQTQTPPPKANPAKPANATIDDKAPAMRIMTVRVPRRERGYPYWFTPFYEGPAKPAKAGDIEDGRPVVATAMARGRAWPVGDTVVEVYDSEGDPTPFHAHKIGQRTLRQLRDNAEIMVMEGGTLPKAEATTPEDRIAQLEGTVRSLEEIIKKGLRGGGGEG